MVNVLSLQAMKGENMNKPGGASTISWSFCSTLSLHCGGGNEKS